MTAQASASWTGRTRGPAFLLMAAGGLAAVILGGQSWYTVPGIDVSFSGKDATGGLAQVLPAVVLAGALLMLTVRTLGRRIVGVLVGLAAIAMTGMGLFPRQPGAGEVASKVRQATLRDAGQLHLQGWNFGYAAAGLVALAGAVLMVLFAHRWPRRPDRFTRNYVAPGRLGSGDDGSGESASASRTGVSPADGPEPDGDAIWKAIDAGQDPTDPAPRDP